LSDFGGADPFDAVRRSATVRFMAGQAAFTTFAFVTFERAPDPHALETDCLAGHIGFEPANPPASYLIGFT
jgi:hypothetical protein